MKFLLCTACVCLLILCGIERAGWGYPVAPPEKGARDPAGVRAKTPAPANTKRPGAGGEASRSPKEKPARPTVYRKFDPPPVHDDQRLAEIGIHKYASKRLRLYTDLPPDEARPLPELMDSAFDAWTDYFGPLPPDREGTEFVITGYLMVNQAPFRESGLLPEDLPQFPHGRNRGTRFWMNEQPTSYYRRHLLLHEGTHCFMTAVEHPLARHVWYMEGMAELFGTHRFDPEGRPQFRVLPHDREQFPYLGRIRLIEEEVRKGPPRDVASILAMIPDDFLSNGAYAWSWGLCQFLDGHPRYRDQFRQLGRAVTTGDKTDDWDKLFQSNASQLDDEWLLFAANLCHGYDQARAAIDFRAGMPLAPGSSTRVEVAADRGWQSTGVELEKGTTYRIKASGRFVIANGSRPPQPERPAPSPPRAPAGQLDRPWESEPQGISFRYHAGRPLGMLVGTIQGTPPAGAPARTTMLDVVSIGRGATIEAKTTGTLYLRLNDDWSELSDNAGSADAQIETIPATKSTP